MSGRRRIAALLALALVGLALAGCAGRPEAPPAGAAPGHDGDAPSGPGGDAATGNGGAAAPPPDREQRDHDDGLRELFIFRDGQLRTAPPAALADSRLVRDVRDLMSLAARGGAGIVPEASERLPSAALPLASQQRQEGFTHLWVRFEFAPAAGPGDGPGAGHGDVMLYVDIDNPADARLAVQDAADPEQWQMTPLPGYGAWLEREVDLFIADAFQGE